MHLISVVECAATLRSPVAVFAACLINHKRGPHAVFIERAECSCEPRHSSTCIRRTIKWVHHHKNVVVTPLTSDLAFLG